MITYPRTIETARCLFMLKLGGTGDLLGDLSQVADDWPTLSATERLVRSLTIDSDAKRTKGRPDALLVAVPDGAKLRNRADYFERLVTFMRECTYASSTSGARSVAEGALAMAANYEPVYRRVRAEIWPLAQIARRDLGSNAVVRAAIVAYTGRSMGNGATPVCLEILQRIKDELSELGVNLERLLFLKVNSVNDEHRVDMTARTAALLTVLSLAERYGLEVAPSRFLRGPIAELTVVHGGGVASLEHLGDQTAHAAATLRALLHPELGELAQAKLRQLHDLDTAADLPQFARAIGYGTLTFDSGPSIDLLSDLALNLSATATRTLKGAA